MQKKLYQFKYGYHNFFVMDDGQQLTLIMVSRSINPSLKMISTFVSTCHIYIQVYVVEMIRYVENLVLNHLVFDRTQIPHFVVLIYIFHFGS